MILGLWLLPALPAQAAEPSARPKAGVKTSEPRANSRRLAFGGEHIAKKDKAREIYERAIEAILDDKIQEAELLLAQAFAIDSTYDLAANLGDVELQNHKPEFAAKHLLFAMNHLPSGVSEEFTQKLRKRFEEAQRLVGAFRLNVQPRSASVSIDGQSISGQDIAQGVFVKPGEHRIRVEEEGFEARERLVSVEAGEARDLLIELQKKPEIKVSAAPAEAFKSPPSFVSGTGHLVLFTTLATSAVAFGYSMRLNDETNAEFRKLTIDSDRMQQMQGPDACMPGEEPKLTGACNDLKVRLDDINERKTLYTAGYITSGIFFAGFLAYGAYTLWKDTKTTVLPTVTRNAGALVLTRVW